ncbi:MAG: SMP-30/gluconolactonase/LRE family protein [Pseudomonadota bacterium]
MTEIYDDRPCELGEGPLWHPGRGQLFWFDILGRKLLSRTAAGPLSWSFGECVSAAGWIDRDRLLVASETALSVFDLTRGTSDRVVPLVADRPDLRSNDGRADPWGGFWIGTMGKRAEPGQGSVWRLYRGEMRRLFAPLTIPNAISFTPDALFAHFADSATGVVWRVGLDEAGWPAGDPVRFIDLAGQPGVPDGAVCDTQGNLWLAEWGAARVACYGPDGRFRRAVAIPGLHASCPAFGGPALDRLHVTSARENLPPEVIAAEPRNGCTFVADAGATGLAEPGVAL